MMREEGFSSLLVACLPACNHYPGKSPLALVLFVFVDNGWLIFSARDFPAKVENTLGGVFFFERFDPGGSKRECEKGVETR